MFFEPADHEHVDDGASGGITGEAANRVHDLLVEEGHHRGVHVDFDLDVGSTLWSTHLEGSIKGAANVPF